MHLDKKKSVHSRIKVKVEITVTKKGKNKKGEEFSWNMINKNVFWMLQCREHNMLAANSGTNNEK
jgi:hypothetical protein